MKWQDKFAVLKLEGFIVRQSYGWSENPAVHWRFICEVDDDNVLYGVGNTKAQAVNAAWTNYVERLNDKNS